MDAGCDPRTPVVVVMKSAQVGWTEAINNTVGFHVHRDTAPIMLVQPTLDMAEAWSKDRLAPMLRDTPVLKDKIADPKSRDSGNTLLRKSFVGGSLTIVGANSPTGLRSRSIRVLLFDEVDAYPASAGPEGDPISLATNRTKTFRNRKILMGSTPTIKGVSRIEKAFNESDQRYYFVPCPHCKEFQRLVWSQVKWDDGKPDTAHYVCVHCGTLLTDADKPAMLRAGEWRPTATSAVVGFHISELYSPWSTWVEMAAKFLVQKTLPETLKDFVNSALGETWEDSGDAVKPEGLLARKEAYTDAAIPQGVLLLTRGTDVQDDRLESTLWGFGADGEMWRVRHDVLRGDPGRDDLWRDHDAILKQHYRTEDGRELVCESVAVDSGGHFTEQVYNYCAARKRFRVFAIKGVPGPKPAWPKRASRGGKRRLDVWPIGVDTIKDVIGGRLKRVDKPGPGFIHLDSSADDVCTEQLASEVQVYVAVRGRKVRVWKPRRAGIRNEQFDCLVYAYAAMVGRGGQQAIDMRRLAPAVENSEPEQPAVQALAPKQETRRRVSRGGWMSRLR